MSGLGDNKLRDTNEGDNRGNSTGRGREEWNPTKNATMYTRDTSPRGRTTELAQRGWDPTNKPNSHLMQTSSETEDLSRGTILTGIESNDHNQQKTDQNGQKRDRFLRKLNIGTGKPDTLTNSPSSPSKSLSMQREPSGGYFSLSRRNTPVASSLDSPSSPSESPSIRRKLSGYFSPSRQNTPAPNNIIQLQDNIRSIHIPEELTLRVTETNRIAENILHLQKRAREELGAEAVYEQISFEEITNFLDSHEFKLFSDANRCIKNMQDNRNELIRAINTDKGALQNSCRTLDESTKFLEASIAALEKSANTLKTSKDTLMKLRNQNYRQEDIVRQEADIKEKIEKIAKQNKGIAEQKESIKRQHKYIIKQIKTILDQNNNIDEIERDIISRQENMLEDEKTVLDNIMSLHEKFERLGFQ